MTAAPVTTGSPSEQLRNVCNRRLFGRDVARIGKALDAFLDVAERVEAGLDRIRRDALQYVGRNGVAQAIEIVDELAPGFGQEQSVGASIPGIIAALDQPMLNQPVKQPHQRDRLQFKNIGEVDLRKALLLPQPKEYDPLRACRSPPFGAVIDEVTQQARAFDELRNQLTL